MAGARRDYLKFCPSAPYKSPVVASSKTVKYPLAESVYANRLKKVCN